MRRFNFWHFHLFCISQYRKGLPLARGPLRCGAQFGLIGQIGLKPALFVTIAAKPVSIASGQHRYEERSQRCRVVANSVSNLTGPRIQPQTSRTNSNVLNDSSVLCYWCRRSWVRFPVCHIGHSCVANVSPRLRRFFGAVLPWR